MKREELEHIIRTSGDITDQYEFVIIGSQSILGPVPNPPAAFTVSMEVDIYPLQSPELADKIDGALGEGSHFHKTHGYYARCRAEHGRLTEGLAHPSTSRSKRQHE